MLLDMARPERFELPTARFVAEYSIQLSYGRLSEPLIIVFTLAFVNIYFSMPTIGFSAALLNAHCHKHTTQGDDNQDIVLHFYRVQQVFFNLASTSAFATYNSATFAVKSLDTSSKKPGDAEVETPISPYTTALPQRGNRKTSIGTVSH